MAGGAGDVTSAAVTDLRTTASPLAIPTIRTIAADLAVRAGFDLDSVDELRIAVDEACALLVQVAAPKAKLKCRFTVRLARVELAAEVGIDDIADPLPVGSVGWELLNCLADEVNALVLPAEPREHGRVCIALVKDRVTTQRP
jgi:serine/threonine-protein kinase RsbW